MTSDAIIKSAKKTLVETANAIKKQSTKLPTSFSEITRFLATVEGKIVFTGVGKSGHIARKLSSTFSSIGAPSTFMQPTDANHGDLGMVNNKDAFFIISNSGDSIELRYLLDFAKMENIKTIGFCSNKKSFLARNVSLSLILEKSVEADPLELIPTTSTSLALAVGDALAIEIMKKKNVDFETFGKRHPSGSIGFSLLKVKSIMRKKSMVPLVSEEMEMREAVLEISKKGLGVTGVLNQKEELIGLITDGDLRRNFEAILTKKVSQIMTTNPKVVDEETLIKDAILFMNKSKITSMFVTRKDSKCPLGIIHIHDCLRTVDHGD